MSFSRANSLGWALYEVLTSAQMNALDIDHANAIDGVGGGTYNPSAPVIFGAHDFQASPSAGEVVFQDEYIDHASHTAIRDVSLQGAFFDYDWDYNSSDGMVIQTGTTAGNNLSKMFVLSPMVGTLTQVSIYVIGASGHGALPATMPSLAVRYLNGSTWASLGSQSDASTTVGAYEVLHEIALTGLSQAFTSSSILQIQLVGESSTNAIVGLKATHAVTRVTCTKGYPQ